MKVFVTNLPWSTDRRTHISKQLDTASVDYEFVECTIGKELSDDDIRRECNVEELRRLNTDQEWLNLGMIGCSLTSQRIHAEIVSRGLDYGVLLEDDAVLPANFAEILDRCSAIIRPGDIILLYWIGWDEICLRKESEIDLGIVKLYEPVNLERVGGGTATIFSNAAAKGLLNVNKPIRIAPDCWSALMKFGAFQRLLVAYPVPVKVADFMSTMEIGRFIWARRLVNKYKIFPLYQILRAKRRNFRESKMKARLV